MNTKRVHTQRPTAVAKACAAVGVLAGGLGVISGLGAASVAAASPANPPSCTTSTTVIWLYIPDGSAAAGSSYFDLRFTNLSGHACVLRGHPGVSAVNLSGQQLGSAASFAGAAGLASVELANGATATSTLRITDVANFPASSCPQAAAAGLRVYPPNQKASKVVPFPFSACGKAGEVFLQVSALQA
jgi:hypothetical protein